MTALGVGGVNIKTAFLTHLHPDYTVGYPDLIFTSWIMGRHEPLAAYGPKGINAMTEHVLKAWQVDVEVRTNGMVQESRLDVDTTEADRRTSIAALGRWASWQSYRTRRSK